jgi:flagellar biosynthesis/type III secretory pathway chaperone
LAEQIDGVNSRIRLLLTDELDVITQFRTLLKSEQESLIAGNTVALSDITASKSAHLDRINVLSSQQLKLIAGLGFKADKSGMAEWANQCPPELRQLWESILDITLDIKSTNLV